MSKAKASRNNVARLVDVAALRRRDVPVFLGRSSPTYGEFADRSARLAGGFRKKGIGQGHRVIVFVPMSYDLYAIVAGLQRIGAVPVFLDSWARRHQLRESVRQAKPIAIIAPSQALRLLARHGFLRRFDVVISTDESVRNSDLLEDIEQENPVIEPIEVEGDHTALITFTTGSSGMPKGANRTHRFLAAQHEALSKVIPCRANDIDLTTFPVFAMNNVASGISTVIPAINLAKPDTGDSARIHNQIIEHGATCLTTSPSLFRALAQYCIENHKQLKVLRRVVTGGAPISKEDIMSFQKIAPKSEIVVLYGSTEVEPICYVAAEEFLERDDTSDGTYVGHPVAGLDIRIIEANKNPVTASNQKAWDSLVVREGEPGELIVSGNHVCGGYIGDTDAFERAKIVSPAGVVWHRTGDIVRREPSGGLVILGRVHNVIRRNGVNLYPVGPEVALKQLSEVVQAAYIGCKDESLGEAAVVAVQSRKGHVVDVGRIKEMMEKRGYPVDCVSVVDSIPMDPRHHSKVDYPALRERLTSENLYATLRTWVRFIRERFSPFLHALFAFVLVQAHFVVANTPISVSRVFFSSVGVFSFLLLLRAFDELKDAQVDCSAHPNRPLVRGSISRGQLIRLSMAAALVSLVTLGQGELVPTLWMLVTLAYALLMFREFFVREWIRPRLVTYALTHTVVMIPLSLALSAGVADEVGFSSKIWLFALAIWMLFNLYEFARKTFAPSEERDAHETYSKRYGLLVALLLGIGSVTLSYLLLNIVGLRNAGILVSAELLFGTLAMVLLVLRSALAAKLYRAMSSLLILIALLSLGHLF